MDQNLLEEKYLLSMIDDMSDMVRVITKEGRVAYTNKSFDKKFGGGIKSVGERCYEVFGQDQRCDNCLAQEGFLRDAPQQVIRRYNKRIYSVMLSPLKDEEGKTLAMVEVFRDTTLEYNIKQNLLMQNAKMQKDLNLAHNLQQSLVKKVLPKIKGYKLNAAFYPCEAVSGDIYDCMVYDDKLVMYIADVSGHGVMPSMLSVFFSRTVRTACSLGMMKPNEIFKYTQKEFLSLNLADSIYITGFIVVLDTRTGEFYYSNAGLSVEPLIYDGTIHEISMGAPPISRWFKKPEFVNAKSRLEPGNRLLIYSDGINGIQGETGAKERLCELFGQQPFNSDKFISTVKSELYASPEDDLTILICERV